MRKIRLKGRLKSGWQSYCGWSLLGNARAVQKGGLKSGKALGGSTNGQEAARIMRDRGYALIGIDSGVDRIRSGVSKTLENMRLN